MIKTLVEFYDSENLENVFSLLSMTYDKVLFLTFEEDGTATAAKNDKALIQFMKRRAPHLLYAFISIKEKKFTEIIDTLKNLLQDGNTYDFDLTGGSEMVIAAIGHVVAASENPNLSIHQYDIKSGRTVFRHPDYTVLNREPAAPKLSVPEIVSLHGATINAPYTKLHPDIKRNNLKNEILRLWKAVKDHTKEWNTFCSLPFELNTQKGRLLITKKAVSDKQMESCKTVALLLQRQGILSDIRAQNKNGAYHLSFQLHVPDNAYFLYEKAGNILEMYTYIAALESGVFTDVCVSVPVDWDGTVTTDLTDTTNEIDLILSTGHIPVCVSCKNCDASSEYFYEIHSVCRHYCGGYAKAVLVSNAKNLPAVQKRATAMNILLIENVAKLTYADFVRKLSEAAK